MLDENKLIYEEFANTYLPNWKEANKNDLIRKASVLPDGIEKDAHVAAIMLKYWNITLKMNNPRCGRSINCQISELS